MKKIVVKFYLNVKSTIKNLSTLTKCLFVFALEYQKVSICDVCHNDKHKCFQKASSFQQEISFFNNTKLKHDVAINYIDIYLGHF